MGLDLVDVDHHQPGRAEGQGRGGQSQIGVVLVVDGVELAPLDEAQEVGELEGDDPGVFDQGGQALGEATKVGHMGEDVVGDHQVGPAVGGRDVASGGRAQELDFGGDPLGPGRLGHVGRGLDPEHRDPIGQKVLQQIAVIGGHLGHQGTRIEPETPDHGRGVAPGVGHPRVRI